MSAGRDIVRPLRRARRAGATVALFLDYDGTLTPIVARPDLATLPASRRALLAALARTPGVAIAVVSGRRLAEVRRLVGLPGIYYAGTGGMRTDLRGRIVRHPDEAACIRVIRRARRLLRPLTGRWPGAWIESKPVGLTLHYREVPPGGRARLRRATRTALAPVLASLRLIHPRDAIEILPRIGWHKGDAVRIILGDLRPAPLLPCYVGDDANDVEAFGAVRRAGGFAVGVGDRAPASAAFHLADPGAVDRMLRLLRRELSASSRPR